MPLTPQELRQRAADSHAKAAAEAKTLLDAANGASQTVAALHIAFMAVCAYVLVIVFGTTDLDLLMGGNNVKLPVIDVAVPIVGFYAAAPYLVVLMHLNLLLQLQLLSRKLFAFDTATPAEEGIGGLRDRLHIFPYTYYLVGRPGAVVGGMLGLVVSVTLIVLPLATLLAMQLKFLAYQAESITWAQRVAVFLDVGFLVALWPVILHPRDDWKAWWHETLAAHLPRKRTWLAAVVLVASVVLVLFAATPDLFTAGLILGAVAPLVLVMLDGRFSDERIRRAITPFAVLLGLFVVLLIRMWGFKGSSPLSVQPAIPVELFLVALPLVFFWHPTAPRGSLALLAALALTPLLTLGLIVDGESWETATTEVQKRLLDWRMLDRQAETLAKQFEIDRCRPIGQTVLSCVVLAEQRRLDLDERALFAKPPNPELLAALRAGKGLENKDKLERVSLADRSLRRAQMKSTLLVGADLRNAQLQGAVLWGAHLQSAVLWGAHLQSADLSGAQLQSAVLWGTHLQGADLWAAQLQGANLSRAQLQSADLSRAQLQGANLSWARLEGANLSWAQLQGTDLAGAQLQGANLSRAQLQGANLSRAQLQGTDLSEAQLQGTDLSRAQLQGANLKGATFYRNGDPEQSDLLDIRRMVVKSLSPEEFSTIEPMLESISFYRNGDSEQSELDIHRTVVKSLSQLSTIEPMPNLISFYGKQDSLQRLKQATEPGSAIPTFASCIADQESQPKCQQTYDETKPDQRREFKKRLHEVLVAIACKDADTARSIFKQIPNPNCEPDSTHVGLATVFLERMKANPSCAGLTDLSAEDKAKLEKLAKKEIDSDGNGHGATVNSACGAI